MTGPGAVHATSKGLAFVLSAPSGGGKTSLCRSAVEFFPDIVHSVSYTTRPPRPGEMNGRDYFFVSRREFQDLVERDEFVEWAEVFGHLYGTGISKLRSIIASGKDVILDIDIQGARQLRRRLPQSIHIFVLPPGLDALEERLRRRGSDPETVIRERLQAARAEIGHYREYQYLIVNRDLQESVLQLQAIIIAERSKTAHYRPEDLGLPLEPGRDRDDPAAPSEATGERR